MKAEASKEEVKIPKWVEKIDFKGDMSLRYQGEERDNADGTSGQSRSRGRFRLRAGFEAEVNPQWKAGFGFASGSADPRSTNQTLENTFDSPDLRYVIVVYCLSLTSKMPDLMDVEEIF